MEAQKQPEQQTAPNKLLVIVDDWMDHDNPNMMKKAGESVSSAESLTLWYIMEPCTVNLGVRPIPQLEEAKLKKILGALFSGPDPLVRRPKRKPRQEIKDLCGQTPLYILLRADFAHNKWVEQLLDMPGLVSDLVEKLKEESVFKDDPVFKNDPVFKRLLNNKRVHGEEIKDKFRQLLRWCVPRLAGHNDQSRLVAKLLALDYIEDLIDQHNYHSNRIKFCIDTCFDEGKTISPLGRAVDHPSYLINRDEKTLAKFVEIIDSKSKEEEEVTQKKHDLFTKWRKSGAPSTVDAAETINKLIEVEDKAKLTTEQDNAEKIMTLLDTALKEQQKKLADLLGDKTELVSDLQMNELVEAINKAPETRMFCGASLTIAAKLQKRGAAPNVELFVQGGSKDSRRNIVGHSYNFALNLEAAKSVLMVQIGCYEPKTGEDKTARFDKVILGPTELGQDILFDPEALWGSSKLQKKWTTAYGVSKYRRDPFSMLKNSEPPPVSEKEKQGMVSADAVAWLAANSESFNKDLRDVSETWPKTLIVMQSGAMIFSSKEHPSKSKEDGYYPIPHGRIEMLMPLLVPKEKAKAEAEKVTLSVKQVEGYMKETKDWMKSGKSGWACSTAPARGRPKDRRSSSATGGPRADSATSARPRREGTPTHTAKKPSRPQSPASQQRQRQQSPAKGGRPRGGTNQDQRDP